jgi:hypothetical protein
VPVTIFTFLVEVNYFWSASVPSVARLYPFPGFPSIRTGVPYRPRQVSDHASDLVSPMGILALLHLVPITWILWIPIVPLRSIYHYDGSAAQRRPTPGQNSSIPSPYRSSLHILGIVQRRNPLQHREFFATMENGWYPERPLFLEGSLAAQPIHPRCLVGSDHASHKARH